MRIIILTLLFFCFSCSDNTKSGTTSTSTQKKEYNDSKMVKGRTYTEIKIFDKQGSGKPKERLVQLDRPTNDPVSKAMHELVNSGLRYSGKNINVDKIERDGDQWEISFKSNKTPPKNLGTDGNYMVIKTLQNYIDNFNIYLDDEIIYTSDKKSMTKKQIDSLVRKEQIQIEKDLDKVGESNNH